MPDSSNLSAAWTSCYARDAECVMEHFTLKGNLHFYKQVPERVIEPYRNKCRALGLLNLFSYLIIPSSICFTSEFLKAASTSLLICTPLVLFVLVTTLISTGKVKFPIFTITLSLSIPAYTLVLLYSFCTSA